MDARYFEKLVSEALESLPIVFKDKLDNVDIVVEEWPSREMARGRLLLGLYQGVPKTTYGRGHGLVIPDKITIFRMPIMWISQGDEKMIKKLVVDTVEHEIAHHFGISDKRLTELKR